MAGTICLIVIPCLCGAASSTTCYMTSLVKGVDMANIDIASMFAVEEAKII